MDATPARSDPRARAAAAPRRFDAVTIGLHWATLALVAGMFASALSMAAAADREQADLLLTVHRSLGAVTWVLAVGRLSWRLLRAHLPPFPATMSQAQQWAAKLTEYGLYAILLVQPMTGLAQSVARGRPFRLFAWDVSKVMARDKGLAGLLHQIHALTAWALLGLIGLHVLAALFHCFVLKDAVLQSMLPWKPSIGKGGRQTCISRE
jgi:cytochrome b561